MNAFLRAHEGFIYGYIVGCVITLALWWFVTTRRRNP